MMPATWIKPFASISRPGLDGAGVPQHRSAPRHREPQSKSPGKRPAVHPGKTVEPNGTQIVRVPHLHGGWRSNDLSRGAFDC